VKKEIIQTWNNEQVILIISDDDYCYCPVCGVKSKNKEWRPYDDRGQPSYDICSCGFQYGYNDSDEPPYEISWSIYRKKWMNDQINETVGEKLTPAEKRKQLKNIGVQEEVE